MDISYFISNASTFQQNGQAQSHLHWIQIQIDGFDIIIMSVLILTCWQSFQAFHTATQTTSGNSPEDRPLLGLPGQWDDWNVRKPWLHTGWEIMYLTKFFTRWMNNVHESPFVRPPLSAMERQAAKTCLINQIWLYTAESHRRCLGLHIWGAECWSPG